MSAARALALRSTCLLPGSCLMLCAHTCAGERRIAEEIEGDLAAVEQVRHSNGRERVARQDARERWRHGRNHDGAVEPAWLGYMQCAACNVLHSSPCMAGAEQQSSQAGNKTPANGWSATHGLPFCTVMVLPVNF